MAPRGALRRRSSWWDSTCRRPRAATRPCRSPTARRSGSAAPSGGRSPPTPLWDGTTSAVLMRHVRRCGAVRRAPIAHGSDVAWKGAHVFSRGEGMWWAGGAVYFTATSGGTLEDGQVWRYVPSSGMIELLYESTDRNQLEAPDNITVHPTSGEIFVCEDGQGTDFIRAVTPEGLAFPFARVALTPDDPRQRGLPNVADTVG